MARYGSLLEQNIGSLFKKIGFDVNYNKKKFGFEVDVHAFKKGYDIIIECKEYQHSHITIQSYLHQWSSKGRKAGVDKIVLVIWGQDIKDHELKEAKELGVYLWDKKIIDKLSNIEDRQKLKEEINKLIQFDEKAYRKIRTKTIIKKSLIFSLVFIGLIYLGSLFFNFLNRLNISRGLLIFFVFYFIFIWMIIRGMGKRKLRFRRRRRRFR